VISADTFPRRSRLLPLPLLLFCHFCLQKYDLASKKPNIFGLFVRISLFLSCPHI
jgi:hypothetical protein